MTETRDTQEAQRAIDARIERMRADFVRHYKAKGWPNSYFVPHSGGSIDFGRAETQAKWEGWRDHEIFECSASPHPGKRVLATLTELVGALDKANITVSQEVRTVIAEASAAAAPGWVLSEEEVKAIGLSHGLIVREEGRLFVAALDFPGMMEAIRSLVATRICESDGQATYETRKAAIVRALLTEQLLTLQQHLAHIPHKDDGIRRISQKAVQEMIETEIEHVAQLPDFKLIPYHENAPVAPAPTEAEIAQAWATYSQQQRIGKPTVAAFVLDMLRKYPAPVQTECQCRRLGGWDGEHHPLCDAAPAPVAPASDPAANSQCTHGYGYLCGRCTSGAATAPAAKADGETIYKKVVEAIRLADNVGRSRGSNNYALNRRAVEKLVDLKMEIAAMLQAHRHQSGEAGEHAGDTYLCKAWGETDLPAAAIVVGMAGVRAFLISEWIGSTDAAQDDGTNSLEDALQDMQEQWAREGEAWEWALRFEIGGVSVQKVGCAAPAPTALADLRAVLVGAIVEHTDSSESWAEGIVQQAMLAGPFGAPAARLPSGAPTAQAGELGLKRTFKRYDADGKEDPHGVFVYFLDMLEAVSIATALPGEPDVALLASMATCLNHGFGILPAEAQRNMLYDMRKLYNEVAGQGYYRPESRQTYTRWLSMEIDGGERASGGMADLFASQAIAPEPIYQLRRADGSWIDQAEQSYRNNIQYAANIVRIVYEAPASVQRVGGLASHPVVVKLIEVARCAYLAMDDSEEQVVAQRRCHVVDAGSFDSLSNALDALDELPDDQPGHAMGPAQKAEWALRGSATGVHQPSAAPPPAPDLEAPASGAAPVELKVTPAMRGWLEHIGRGGEIRRSAQFFTGPYSTPGRGGLTYVMVGKLEDAGLIEWEQDEPLGTIQHVRARLTDAGRAAIETKNARGRNG
ncbi:MULTISPECIES: hypothetical protein [Cupriavidus]|uniref:Uncharacterized protein n=2 Tax=Cupriavidus TaxID=106589 RepID=A0A3G8GUZ9_9BURK|nr:MULTISPECIES: hypothetical protein [Cupriavidus]AZG12033.1 hypothetical protein EHF44_00690 [Cupriavidus pauculus]MWL91698.1 hypothetical protein [Cupriavidus sp. SW-Y-13]QBP14464.1 hypothetical protein DDF84_032650 [Cupriavidus metallidurans]